MKYTNSSNLLNKTRPFLLLMSILIGYSAHASSVKCYSENYYLPREDASRGCLISIDDLTLLVPLHNIGEEDCLKYCKTIRDSPYSPFVTVEVLQEQLKLLANRGSDDLSIATISSELMFKLDGLSNEPIDPQPAQEVGEIPCFQDLMQLKQEPAHT